MTSPIQRQGRQAGYGAILTIALSLVIVSGCERHRTAVEAAEIEETGQNNEAPVAHRVLAAEHSSLANRARADGKFLVCADEFAAAARASDTAPRTTENWYQASRCAARAGDYRSSTFYLSSAASSGFAELAKLMREPLFRPLYSGSRWDLVVEVVAANERALPAKGQTIASEEPATPICELIERLRNRIQAPG